MSVRVALFSDIVRVGEEGGDDAGDEPGEAVESSVLDRFSEDGASSSGLDNGNLDLGTRFLAEDDQLCRTSLSPLSLTHVGGSSLPILLHAHLTLETRFNSNYAMHEPSMIIL